MNKRCFFCEPRIPKILQKNQIAGLFRIVLLLSYARYNLESKQRTFILAFLNNYRLYNKYIHSMSKSITANTCNFTFYKIKSATLSLLLALILAFNHLIAQTVDTASINVVQSELKSKKNIQPIPPNVADSTFLHTPQSNQPKLKAFIAPTVLIGSGFAFRKSKLKYDLNEWRYQHFNYHRQADDYLRFAPILAVTTFNALGVSARNNPGNQTAILLKSMLLSSFITGNLKKMTPDIRPDGGANSFPSGHTTIAFALAHWMHREYGENSIFYSIGAYGCASAVGIMRISKGAHWFPDVLAGAGIGMLSTELVYLTHQHKWGKKHLRRFDLLPFRTGKTTGVAILCPY